MELLKYRREFRVTERYAFLNHASVSAQNRRVVHAVGSYMVRAQRQPFDRLQPDLIALRETVSR